MRPQKDIEDEPAAEIERDRVPSMEQEAPIASYKDWTSRDTMIIVYAVGTDIYPGIRVASRAAAVRHATGLHGKILEANYVEGRAFLRVRRPRGS